MTASESRTVTAHEIFNNNICIGFKGEFCTCKIKVGTAKKYDTGLVTKLKTRKSDNEPTHIYVEMDDGKKVGSNCPHHIMHGYFLNGGAG